MAEVTETNYGPKLRARKDGAAVALDDLDKRLLNLMQGQFPGPVSWMPSCVSTEATRRPPWRGR